MKVWVAAGMAMAMAAGLVWRRRGARRFAKPPFRETAAVASARMTGSGATVRPSRRGAGPEITGFDPTSDVLLLSCVGPEPHLRSQSVTGEGLWLGISDGTEVLLRGHFLPVDPSVVVFLSGRGLRTPPLRRAV